MTDKMAISEKLETFNLQELEIHVAQETDLSLVMALAGDCVSAMRSRGY